MPDPDDFLALLLEGAPATSHDELRDSLLAEHPAEADRIRDQHARVLQLREQMEDQRRREAELAALYETAGDLTAIRDLDEILAAIVRRARQLLRADMTYLSLNDPGEGASYMKVTDGALTQEFRRLRLPLGTGLLGLVAQTGEPYFTEDYQSDERFVHRSYIDDAVGGEQIRAILGVPLMVDGEVIGTLLAVHRTVRHFPAAEVALLTSFAAHAAVALQNAQLFEQASRAVEEAAAANRELAARSEATERAAHAHDLLTDAVLHGGGVAEVHTVLDEVLVGEGDGALSVLGTDGRLLAGPDLDPDLVSALPPVIGKALASGRSESVPDRAATWVALAAAGDEHLSTLVLTARQDLPLTERRTLERGALVTALVQLFARVEAEATDRVRGELLGDVLLGRETDPARLRERATRQGVHLDGPLAVVAAAPGDDLPLRRGGRLAADLARETHGLGGEHAGLVVLVGTAQEDPLACGRALLGRLGDGATVGVAGAESVDGIPRAHDEATRVVSALLALGRRGEVSDPARLGVARLLLTGTDPRQVEEFLAATTGPLRDYDARRGTELVDTVSAWFEAGGSAAGAARALHVHTNTVAQRLERVAELLGADWRSPTRSVDLQLALRIDRLRGV